MDREFGLDVHAASTTMAVVGPTNRRIRLQVLDTSAGPLVEALRAMGRRCPVVRYQSTVRL